MNEIAKLPKWAQEHIANLQRERDLSVRTLNEFQNSQTPSKIWTDDWVCSGEEKGPTVKTHYIQSRSVNIKVGNSEVHLYLRRDNVLEISTGTNTLYFKPQASNVIHIEDMSQAAQ